MLEQYWLDLLDLEPMLGLSHNDERHREEFDDSLEDGWRTQMMALIDKYLAGSAAFPAESLSENDRTSLAMLREQLTLAKDYYSGSLFETARMLPIDQFQGEHSSFAADAAGAGDFPFKTVEDYDKALARADAYARWTHDAIRRMREGVKAGVLLPRIVVERVLPQLRVHTGLAPEKTEFWHPIEQLPAEFPPADRQRLAAAYRRKIETVIEPAYRRLYEFLNGRPPRLLRACAQRRVSEVHGAGPDHSRLRSGSPRDRAPAPDPVRCAAAGGISDSCPARVLEELAGERPLLRRGPERLAARRALDQCPCPGGQRPIQRHDPHAARGTARTSLSDLRRAGAAKPPLVQALRFHERLRRRLGALCRVAGQGNGIVR
jgi:hypothetical protein